MVSNRIKFSFRFCSSNTLYVKLKNYLFACLPLWLVSLFRLFLNFKFISFVACIYKCLFTVNLLRRRHVYVDQNSPMFESLGYNTSINTSYHSYHELAVIVIIESYRYLIQNFHHRINPFIWAWLFERFVDCLAENE